MGRRPTAHRAKCSRSAKGLIHARAPDGRVKALEGLWPADITSSRGFLLSSSVMTINTTSSGGTLLVEIDAAPT